MKNIIVLSPNVWDEEEITGTPRSNYNFKFYGPLLQKKDNPPVWEMLKFLFSFRPTSFSKHAIEDLAIQKVDGILGTDDYMACPMAAVLADKMGLPGPSPYSVALAMHKGYSRKKQQELCPNETPKFAIVGNIEDVRSSQFKYPFFIKPVRGTSSILAKKISNERELKEYFEINLLRKSFLKFWLRPYDDLLKYCGLPPLNKKYLIIEECLEGTQLTFEGFMNHGEFNPLGIIDSVMYPHSRVCFNRFIYPSRIPQNIQKRIETLSERLIKGIGYEHGVFNIEFFYNEKTDNLHIIEINPRLSFQFTDFYKNVDGFNSFDVQLALVSGEEIKLSRRKGNYKLASSFALRKFQDYFVKKEPSEHEIKFLFKKYPELRLRLFAHQKTKMSSQWLEDPESFRYAVFNLAGKNEADILSKYEEVRQTLDYYYSFQAIDDFENSKLTLKLQNSGVAKKMRKLLFASKVTRGPRP